MILLVNLLLKLLIFAVKKQMARRGLKKAQKARSTYAYKKTV